MKTIIVTGGSQGIGAQTALKLANMGYRVIIADLAEKDFIHENCEFVKLDVTNREDCENLVKYVKENCDGKIQGLVNNAGITKDALTAKMTELEWDLVIKVNLKGVFNVTQALLPVYDTSNTSIVNISSIVGEYGNIGQANYAATKSAIIALSKTWAKEFTRNGQYNIRVNSLAPGYIDTAMMDTVPEKIIEKLKDASPLKRLGQPSEIANVIAFLISDESSFITGHNLSVNGGAAIV